MYLIEHFNLDAHDVGSFTIAGDDPSLGGGAQALQSDN